MKPAPRWTRTFYRILAAEVSAVTRYYDRITHLRTQEHESDDLLPLVDCPAKAVAASAAEVPDASGERDRRSAVLLNGAFNYSYDIQAILQTLLPRLSRTSRVIAVTYNAYYKWLFLLLAKLGLTRSREFTTFVTLNDLRQLATISGYELVRLRGACYFPFSLLGLGTLINKLLPALPVLRWFSIASVCVLRPRLPSAVKPSLSVIIPARNEAGNIERALTEMPVMPGVDIEIVFVEGHSKDDTWAKIQEVVKRGHPSFKLAAYQQTGRGKNDAVRLGFSKAANEILTILDADLTMPPEMLPRFYQAYVDGLADFVNGSRLVYPMEGEAMRFLNLLGNVFFAKALSSTLGMRIGDSLCGTKLVAAHDYRRITRWRGDFGDFDPFGDFELLFPAAVLGLGCVDIPVRYKARTYGSTNIHRFRHGLVLLKMTLTGWLRIRLGRTG